MNRNRIYVVTGVLIALILIGLLISFMNKESELSASQSYSVEIYFCKPIAQNTEVLAKEMSTFLLSSSLPNSPGFLSPVVNLHDKLIDGNVKKIYIPKSGLTGLREMFVSDYYDFNNRRAEEADMLGENGSFLRSSAFTEFSSLALSKGDTSVNNVPYVKENNLSQFFIDSDLIGEHSVDFKIWRSLLLLHVYLDELVIKGKIAASDVIRIYYKSSPVVPPPGLMDDDGDGVLNKDDQCPQEKGDINCGGCVCPPPPPCPDNDHDGVCDDVDKCPEEFGFKKYGGCKIPDSDGDGYNDEVDKCKTESGVSPDGCPPKITFNYNNETGQFLVNVPNSNVFKAEFVIKEQSGKTVTHAMDILNDLVLAGPEINKSYQSNFDKLFKSIKDPNDLKVKILVKNDKGQVVSEYTHPVLLSLVCYSGGDCGFINLN